MNSHNLPKPWNAPLKLNRFVGRERFLQQLQNLQNDTLKEGKHSSRSTNILAACVGLGGVGKSSLVLEFLYRHLEKYDYVLWVPATTREGAEACFDEFAEELCLSDNNSKTPKWRETLSWLAVNSGWWTVFDGMADYSMVQSYIPCTGGNVLITSRYTEWDCTTINITPFDEGESGKYLELVTQSSFDAADISDFAHVLGDLPLAVVQATAYINKHKISVQEYLKQFKNAQRECTINQILPAVYGSESVLYTWNVSVKTVKIECHFSIDLLEFCSFLDSSYIPQIVLSEFAKQRNHAHELHRAKDILLSYSLISVVSSTKGGVSVHPLVQMVTKSSVNRSDSDRYVKDLCNCIETVWPSDPERDHDIVRDIHTTIQACLHCLRLEGDPMEQDDTRLTVAVQLETLFIADHANRILGNINLNLSLLKRMKVSAKTTGINYLKKLLYALILHDLGNAYGSIGDYQRQEELLERALVIKEKHYGPDHKEVAITLGNLGNAYGDIGDYQRQKELLERALVIEEKRYGPDHKEVAITLTNLGNAYGSIGDYQRQKELLERALVMKEKHYGPDHKEVAITLASLGNAYGSIGDYQRQKELLERALLVFEQHFGCDHTIVAQTLTNLGNAYGSIGEYQRQKELLERALVITEKHYGPDHQDVAIILGNLGNAYGSIGDYQRQKELLERALVMKEKHYGPDHKEVAITLASLGNAYGDIGDYQRQKELLERALLVFEQHFGCDHTIVAQTLTNLGNAYGSIGDYQRQKELLERALLVLEQHFGFMGIIMGKIIG